MMNSSVFSRYIFCCCGCGVDVLFFLSSSSCFFVVQRDVINGGDYFSYVVFVFLVCFFLSVSLFVLCLFSGVVANF